MNLTKSSVFGAAMQIFLAVSLGCQSVGSMPFGRRTTTSANSEVTSNSTPDNPHGAGADFSSQELAARSRELSAQCSAISTPELAKYAANPVSDENVTPNRSATYVSSNDGARRTSSRCTNGCCR